MSTISMFFGIIIRMYNNGEHNSPHFHATYQGNNAVFNMDGDLIEGDMPRKQVKLLPHGQKFIAMSFLPTGSLP